VLEDAGLVQVREDGTRNIYSIRMQGFAEVRDFLDDFWDAALARLEELAQR
jgi:DNA-binding PadR family transcriptional regulator